jgi:uncharacterized protein DUF6188
MDLGFRGQSVVSEEFGFTIAFEISGDYEIRTGTPFLLSTPAGNFRFQPDEEPEGNLDRLRELIGHTVTEATTDKSGTLHVAFDNNARLRIDPDTSYEAWTVSGPHGMLVVCMPGGELAIWDEKTDD